MPIEYSVMGSARRLIMGVPPNALVQLRANTIEARPEVAPLKEAERFRSRRIELRTGKPTTSYSGEIASRCSSVFQRLDANGRPVAQHLCHAFHQLVRVIADADHCVGPRHMRLNQHCVESLLAGSLSEFRKERDIAAKHRLQAGADGPENRSRSDDDTTYHAKIVHDSESRHVEAGRCHVCRNVCCLRMDDGRHKSRFGVSGLLCVAKVRNVGLTPQAKLRAATINCER